MTISKMFAAVLLAAFAVAAPLGGQDRPTITFVNRSGDDALVRVVGPVSETVPVADSTQRTITAGGGSYRIFVRYGRPGSYRYTKGQTFSVYEGPDGVDQISITLHTVVGGNYGSSPSSGAEFNGGR